MPSFKKDSVDSPFSKLRGMLKVVDSHFVSLEKVVEGKVLSQFNVIWLRMILKMVEGDRVSFISSLKTIQGH